MSLKEKVVANLSNALGKKTKRKIIVFESDDWGIIQQQKETN